MLALPGGDDESRHGVHSVLSSAEYESAPQSEQVFVDEFTTSECFPAAQAVQATGPGFSLYLPATHAEQAPSLPVQPALHTHDVIFALPAIECAFTHSTHSDLSSAEYEPAVQSMQVWLDAFTASECFPAAQAVHASGPGSSLYLPATHAMQLILFPVQPASQMQAEIDLLSRGDVECGGQLVHGLSISTINETSPQTHVRPHRTLFH